MARFGTRLPLDWHLPAENELADPAPRAVADGSSPSSFVDRSAETFMPAAPPASQTHLTLSMRH